MCFTRNLEGVCGAEEVVVPRRLQVDEAAVLEGSEKKEAEAGGGTIDGGKTGAEEDGR